MPNNFKYILEGRLKNCHLKLRFRMDQNDRLFTVYASTTSLCAEACSSYGGCSGFSFQPLSEDHEKCTLFSESVFTQSENGTAVVGWCPKGNWKF